MRNFNLNGFLEVMLGVSDRVSDLNFSVGKPPQVELDGQLQPVEFAGVGRLAPYQTEHIAMQLMQGNKDTIDALVNTGAVDCSYAIPGKSRFRVNIFQQRGTYAIVLRVINTEIPTVEQLGLPAEINNVADLKNGVVLVTGPTGSGKSTTLAAIIDKINRKRPITSSRSRIRSSTSIFTRLRPSISARSARTPSRSVSPSAPPYGKHRK